MQIKLHKGYCLREDRAVRSAFRIYCLLAVLDAPVFSVSCNYKSQKCLCSGESWRLRILRLHVLFSTFTAEMSRNLLFLPAFCSWYHPQMLPVPLVNRAIYHKSSAFPSSVFFTGEKKKAPSWFMNTPYVPVKAGERQHNSLPLLPGPHPIMSRAGYGPNPPAAAQITFSQIFACLSPATCSALITQFQWHSSK